MHATFSALTRALEQVIFGKEPQIKLALCALLSQGHLLLEDLPGMGKTTLSHALAQLLGLSYQRVQFTSDLLPADILGNSIFNPQKNQFEFHAGPIFSQVVLADEINRAGPKTQSAMLEAMEEQQISIDGVAHALPAPFFVIATQNPSFQSGTFALPESQLDRFFMRLSLGFPPAEAEKRLIQGKNKTHSALEPVLTGEQLQQLQAQVKQVTLADPVVEYILALVTFSRHSEQNMQPLSPRASIAIATGAKAWAFMHGRDYVTPDDVQAVFPAIAEHRINPLGDSQHTQLSQQLLTQVKVVL